MLTDEAKESLNKAKSIEDIWIVFQNLGLFKKEGEELAFYCGILACIELLRNEVGPISILLECLNHASMKMTLLDIMSKQ